MRRASKTRGRRIPLSIQLTRNTAGVDAAVPKFIVYFDRGPNAKERSRCYRGFRL